MVRQPNTRWRWMTTTVASALALPFVASAAPGNATIPPPAAIDSGADRSEEDLFLEVLLNGSSTSRLLHFVRRGAALCASASDLRSIGLRLPPDRTSQVCLGELAGLHYRYDVQQQRVAIDARLDALNLPVNVLNTPQRAAPQPTGGNGLLLNYDLYASRGGGQGNLSGLAELRAFLDGAGVFSNTVLSRRYQVAGQGWRGNTVRLDSQWRLAFPERALALTVGDTLTSYLSWSRPSRIGGIAFGRDFALQPYQITTPLPQFFGEATVPSAVELYIDGIRQYSGRVPAGPFQLTAVPGISTAGQAQVVLTDALGRASTVSFPFYQASQLLRQGLSDWSVELGTVREDYGLRSFSYGSAPVASGSWRYGLSNQLTVESHAEAGHGRATAGAGALWTPAGASVLSGSLARSRDGGSQLGLGYSWTGRIFNASWNQLRTFGRYSDIASGYGAPIPRVSGRALVGINLRNTSFGLNFVQLRYPGQPNSRYAGAYLSKTLTGGAAFSASYTQNLDDARDRSIFLGLTLTLDDRHTLSLSAQRQQGYETLLADASQPIDGDGGFGWHVQGRAGDSAGGLAELGWLGNHGQLTLGASQLGSTRYAYADGNGALVLMDNHLFTARRIDDAFALVSTDGVPGVPVLLENRPNGVTDDRGLLLVARLNAYQDNRLAIDPLELPADMRVQRVQSTVAPSDRAGVLVRFGVRKVRAATLILHDGQGQPLPLGSTVYGGSLSEPALVGYDGMVFLDNLHADTPLRIERPDGHGCRLMLSYPAQARELPQLGPLVCAGTPP
jgi:outer membrane usher protein